MQRIKKRHAAVGMLITGLLTLGTGFALETTAGANPTWDEDLWDAHLHGPHHGASNVTFKKGTCPTAPQGTPFGWHFVLQGSDTSFDQLNVHFQGAGVIEDVTYVAHPTAKHAYVYTAGADVLVDAVASTTGGDEDTFVLSHVCGTPGSTSSSRSVSSESSVSSVSTSQITSSVITSSVASSSESSASVSGSSQVNTSSEEESSEVPTVIATSSPTVSGVQIPAALPVTGIDPGFLLMLGGMLVVSGVLMMRYSTDPA